MLVLIGGWFAGIAQIINGSGLHRFISANLFWFEKRKKKTELEGKTSIDEVRDIVQQRRPAKFSSCLWCTSSKSKTRLEKAVQRIEYPLDILNFIKQ